MTLEERARGRLWPWAESTECSSVVYPNAVFGLERHGVLPFERFAYNALRTSVEILHAADLPEAVCVALDGMDEHPKWSLGAQVRQSTYGDGALEYCIATTPFTPLVLLALIWKIDGVIRNSEGANLRGQASGVRAVLFDLGAAWQQGIEKARGDGLGSGLVVLRDELGVSRDMFSESVEHFDMASQFLVNHELSHVYLQRYSWADALETDRDRRAFELLADLTATSWMYSKYVRNTPDSAVYRQARGVTDHAEAIRLNADQVLYSHLLMLAFMGLASCLGTGGRVDLSGRGSHPHTYLRYIFQEMHFATLVLSNYPAAFDEAQARELGARGRAGLALFLHAGFIRPDDLRVLFSDEWREDCKRAADLAEQHDIAELRGVRQVLADLPALPRLDDLGGGES